MSNLDSWRLTYRKKTALEDLVDHYKGRIIVFAGCPGIGKSAIAEQLAELLGGVYYPEYVQEDLFDAYMNNKGRFAFFYQMMMVKERINTYRKALEEAKCGKAVIIDGPFLTDNAFARLLWKAKLIADDEYALYQAVLNEEVANELPPPDYLVYLDGREATLLTRIKKRGRPGEAESYSKGGFLPTLRHTYAELLVDTEVAVLDYNEDSMDAQDKIPKQRLIEILGLIRDRTFQRIGLPE